MQTSHHPLEEAGITDTIYMTGYGPPPGGGGYGPPPGGGGYGPPPGGGSPPPGGGGFGPPPPAGGGGYGAPPHRPPGAPYGPGSPGGPGGLGGPGGYGGPGGHGPPPNTTLSLVLSIFCTLCSGCFPLGIVGIVFSVQAKNLYNAGDLVGAQQKNKTAMILAIVGLSLGFLFIIISMIAGSVQPR